MRPTDVLAHRRIIHDTLRGNHPLDPHRDRTAQFALNDWRALNATSDAYHVTADMTAVAKAAAKTMPTQTLQPGDLPTPTGFLLFDTPIGTWPDDGNKPVQGFMWEESTIPEDPIWDVNGQPVKWGNETSWRWLVDLEIPPELADDPRFTGTGPPEGTSQRPPDRYEKSIAIYPILQRPDIRPGLLWPTYTADGPIEWVYTCPPTNDTGNVLTVLRAAWTIMQQTLTVTERVGADRAESRRSARSGLIPEVVIVRLRRKYLDDQREDPDTEGVEWSHRWLVSGHWRNQWLPSRNCHRLQWINGYVKGPDHLPLVVKDRVSTWMR